MTLTRRQKASRRQAARRRVKEMLRGHVPHCAYCGAMLYYPTIDHMTPLGHGGQNTPDNFILACKVCNEAKGERDLIEWAADILAAAEKTVATLSPPF